jgi:hypothetical protein
MRIIKRGPWGKWSKEVICVNCGDSILEVVGDDVVWFNFGGHGHPDDFATAIVCEVCNLVKKVDVPDEIEANAKYRYSLKANGQSTG